MLPPTTQLKPHTTTFGIVEGELRGFDESKLINPPIQQIDNYHWLRDDTRTNTEVLEHIEKENAYTNHIMQPHQQLKTDLYNEIKSNIKEDYDSYAYKLDNTSPNRYFRRYSAGKDYPVYYVKSFVDSSEEVLLDVNELACSNGSGQCDVTSFEISPDHQYLSYGIDFDGSEKYQFVIQNIKTKNIIDTPIQKLAYCSYLWVTNRIYYLVSNDVGKLNELWLYDLQTNTNMQIYKEENEKYGLDLALSNDERFIFVSSGDYDTNFVQYIDLKVNSTNLTLFQTAMPNVKYNLEHHNDYWYIHTNLNSANWTVMRVSTDKPEFLLWTGPQKGPHPGKSCILDILQWQEFIPHNPNVYIESFEPFADFFVFTTKIKGNAYINLVDPERTHVKIITHLQNMELSWDDYVTQCTEFNSDNVYDIELGVNNVYETNTINVQFSSLICPTKLFDYNVYTLENKQVYEVNVPNYNSDLYECKRLWVPNGDVLVPMSIVYRKDLYKQDGTNSLYLYGYGSYGYTISPCFDREILPLLNRGYVYAIGHVRGGSFLGYDWSEQGKMFNKINTFNDFIACAEYCGTSGICDPKKIYIAGVSAGGLMIGAVVTMRPDLFKCAIAGVPFVDALNTMSDSTIPLTVEEWTQWCDPNEFDGYNYIKRYCPYTNIKSDAYPHMYCTCGIQDYRVGYWEILKFIAKLREFKTDSNIQVVRIATESGHFGGSSRYKFIEELAEKYAFVFTR